MTAGGGPQDATLRLRVFPEEDSLVWEVVNAGDRTVSLWSQTNSWGWSMPRLHVAPEPGRADAALLVPITKIWTRNVPSVEELAPNESTRYALTAEDLDGLEAVRDHRDQPLWVRGELVSEPSAQAAEHGVWCGTLRSDEERLAPPHRWMGA